ncbi:hypothetical protein PoB_004735000 [Plakobranchus ocellatus]|uniref:Uncharacterized protein n=1 Tax=Plakobranchus ocellatus TaxID=259542 RepID=A0AAV4BJY7_9GAST|nr:hypothetical protein PoB_004735000 [Plakobranchus ocellatus]
MAKGTVDHDNDDDDYGEDDDDGDGGDEEDDNDDDAGDDDDDDFFAWQIALVVDALHPEICMNFCCCLETATGTKLGVGQKARDHLVICGF